MYNNTMTAFIILVSLLLLLGIYNWAPGPWRAHMRSDHTLPGPAAHNPGELVFCLAGLILLAYASQHFFGHHPY